MRMCHLLGHMKPLGPCVRGEIININMRMDMVDVPVPGEDVEEIPNLHRRPVEAWHRRRGHLLPVPVRRRQVCVRRVEAPHCLGALPHHRSGRRRGRQRGDSSGGGGPEEVGDEGEREEEGEGERHREA